jgi:hypothetical protein
MLIALYGVGWVLVLLGEAWIIMAASQEGVLWAMGCVFFFPLQLIYVARNWKGTKIGFCLLISGTAVEIVSHVNMHS